MTEVLVEFSEPVVDESGNAFTAQACGRVGVDGRWEGWIEFIPVGKRGEALRTARETTQPNRTDLAYWASGLSMVFLEGALQRAKNPTPSVRIPVTNATTHFDGPAPDVVEVVVDVEPRAVLDPFAVYAQGEEVLRQELTALNAMHLRNILRRYAPGQLEERASEAELRARIVELARDRARLVSGSSAQERPTAG